MKHSILFAVVLLSVACGSSPQKSSERNPAEVVDVEDLSPAAKKLPVCSSEERFYRVIEVIPGHHYQRGDIRSSVQKTGPSMKRVFVELRVKEAPETPESNSYYNAWRKTQGDTWCLRYQPRKFLDGHLVGPSDCLVYTCAFTEREP